MAWPKIVYEDVPVGAQDHTIVTAEDRQPWCDPQSMLEEIATPQVATLEEDYWVLGKNFRFFPDTPTSYNWGWWSASMCDENGDFATPPAMEWTLEGGLFTCIGLTFTFDPYGPTWPTWMKVQWYRDDELLADKVFHPNGYQYSAFNTVRLFNRLVISFDHMTHGYRYLKVQRGIYGIVRTFGKDEYSNASIYEAVNLISNELEIGDLVFNVRNLSTLPFSFLRKQQLAVYHGDTFLGLRFITAHDEMSDGRYKITAQDYLGLLSEGGDHFGGVYDGEMSEDLLADILGDDIPYTLDDELKGIPIYGWLPKASRLDNLARVLFAIGGCASTFCSRVLRLFRPKTSETAIPISLSGRTRTGTTVHTDKVVTGVQVTEHSFVPGTDTAEVFKGALDGTDTVTFSEPMCALSIDGGTIEEWGANYAIISGNGGMVTLTGTKYNHFTKVLTKENTLVEAGTIPNVKKCTDAYLVSPHNSAEVLERYFEYHRRNTYATAELRLDGDEMGDLVSLGSALYNGKVGNLISVDLTLSKKLVANVRILLEDDTG